MRFIYEFPTATYGNGVGVMGDSPSAADTFLATLGAAVATTSVLPASQQSAVHTKLAINQVTFSVNLIATLANNTTPPYATFGKLLAACYVNSAPGAVSLLQLDAALLATLWDGQNDASPPIRETGTTPVPVNLLSATITPPEPIEVDLASRFFGIGLWLTPSAVWNVGLLLTQAAASVSYDEVAS